LTADSLPDYENSNIVVCIGRRTWSILSAMSRKSFFVTELPGYEDSHVEMTGPKAHHMIHVLRLVTGDSVELRDGRGGCWRGDIVSINKGAVQIRIDGEQDAQGESQLNLTLALAQSRSDRMDLVLRQATELGIRRFITFRAQRSQYGLTETQKRRKVERWSKIVREAICQCGRVQLPEIVILGDVSSFLDSLSVFEREGRAFLKVLALEKSDSGGFLELWRKLPLCDNIVTAVGPEGGWTTMETEQFLKAGFETVSLGPRVLRFETAATAVLSATQLLWGDLNKPPAQGGR
jgi:16S rRNA (uracil1498-N3)-methyltransferase